MGNPTRYICDNKFVSRPAGYGETLEKIFSFGSYDVFSESYETLQMDMYQAPDVIEPYSNGNTNKDEFRRYWRDIFTNVKLVQVEKNDNYFEYKFSYESVVNKCFSYDSPELTKDIPIGKFAGMSEEEVKEYKTRNVVKYAKIN